MAHEMFLGEDFFGSAKNIYEAVMIISNRARQIAEQQRREMDDYLSQIEVDDKFSDDEEGMIEDAPVLHEPLIQFEKPTILSLREMIAEKLVDKNVPEVEEVIEEDDQPSFAFPSKLSLSLDDEEESGE